MFVLFVTVCEILAIEIVMTLILTFRMVQGQMQICQSKDHVRLSMCWQ